MYKVRRTPAILIIAIIVFSGIGFILTHTVFADMKQDMENQLKKLVRLA
jgi:Trk-type K+ transport system membrane component